MADWTIENLLPDGAPPPLVPDRGGYTLTMRECSGSEAALARLAVSEPDNGRRAHVGWGSFRNLDIAAARCSAWVLLLDVNLHQFRVWDAVRAALLDPGATDAAAFVGIVLPLLPSQPRLRQFAASTRTWLSGDLERPGSWLFTERPERFARVRGLFRDCRVATGCMDLRGGPQGDAGSFRTMAEHMAAAVRQGLVDLDTLYVSNIPWMMAQDLGFFGESHADFLRPGVSRALDPVHVNLRAIAPAFRQVVSASHLRPDATPDNLQWHTEVLPPAAFLDDDYWRTLTAVAAG